MLAYPDIDPVAFAIGPVKVHWYGLMYVLGFIAGWWLARRRAAMPGSTWKPIDVDDLIFFAAVGVIVGGRLGWMLFYGLDNLREDPLAIIRVWEGGMSFHGGLIGVMVARRVVRAPPRPADRRRIRLHRAAAGGRPLRRPHRQFHQWRALGQAHGPALGRAGGRDGPARRRSSTKPCSRASSCLPSSGGSRRGRGRGLRRPGLFLTLYAIFRIAVEFVRVPDADIGYLAFGWLTMGQVLSLPVLATGLAMLAWAYTRREPSGNYA